MPRWTAKLRVLWEWARPPRHKAEDVATDPHVANSRDRATGRTGADAGGTTGTGANDTFVGRASGQDIGYAGETGAEARRDTGS